MRMGSRRRSASCSRTARSPALIFRSSAASRARITSLVFLGFFYQLIDVPAIIVLAFWFVLQLIDGIASFGVSDVSGGVAFFAHIGGFVFGLVVGAAVVLRSRRHRGRAGDDSPEGDEPVRPTAVG